MALVIRYAAPRDWPVERLVESLAALLPVRPRRIPRRRITFLETPDGRVGRAGACLTSTVDAGGIRIQWRQGDLRVGCSLGSPVQFAWDLPQGPLRQRIEPIVAMRRLLPAAEAEQDGVLLDVMDETGKTIARIDIVAGRARVPKPRSSWQPLLPFLTLNALRGYDEACAGPIAIVESRPGIERSNRTLQGHVLQAIGASVPQDVSVYRVALEPTLRADVGALRMLRELLRIVGANQAGVLAGLDSEYLHDFRAGVRRGRSLLGQMEGVLPQAQIEHLKTELCWLGRMTAPVRDLDVLLLGLRSASNDLEPEPHDAILAQLEHERARAQQGLVEQLRSERYRQLINRWTEFVSRDLPRKSAEACGALALVTMVSQRAWRLHQRVLAGVERVHGDTPANELHRIRIDARNLRDLIEAAASLYDPTDLAAVLRSLKPLEAALRGFEAACLQGSWLSEYAELPAESQCEVALVRRGAEALAERARCRAESLRKSVNQQLLRFGEPSNRLAFERVFHIEQPTELVP